MESWFHELEHEPKIRLLKTHSHASERRVYEANKERQGKEKPSPLDHYVIYYGVPGIQPVSYTHLTLPTKA